MPFKPQPFPTEVQKKVIEYIVAHPGRSTLELQEALKCSKQTIYKLHYLKQIVSLRVMWFHRDHKLTMEEAKFLFQGRNAYNPKVQRQRREAKLRRCGIKPADRGSHPAAPVPSSN